MVVVKNGKSNRNILYLNSVNYHKDDIIFAINHLSCHLKGNLTILSYSIFLSKGKYFFYPIAQLQVLLYTLKHQIVARSASVFTILPIITQILVQISYPLKNTCIIVGKLKLFFMLLQYLHSNIIYTPGLCDLRK